jgi:Uma2 family endonuclease
MAIPESLQFPTSFVEPEGLYEVVDGCFVEKPTSVYACWLAVVFSRALAPFAEASALGRVGLQMLFDLPPHVDRERRPDIAFVPYNRWAKDRRLPRVRSWAVVTQLAIEISSRSNTADEVAEKLEEYFKAGLRQVWVVYPAQSKVYAYTSTTAIHILAPGDELDGGDVLPGFRLSVRELFEQAGEPD